MNRPLTRRSALGVGTAAIATVLSAIPAGPSGQARAAVAGLRFELYRSGKKFRWRLKSANGQTMASGEGYNAKADCRRAIDRIIEGASTAEVLDLTERAAGRE